MPSFKLTVSAILMIGALVSFIGCGSSGSKGDPGPVGPSIPVIQSITATGLPAAPGGTVTVSVSAQSAQELALSYDWNVSAGWTVASDSNASSLTLTAPDTYGAGGSATVSVTDENNHTAVGTIPLSTKGNTAPTIQSISIYPQPVMTSANLVASVSDPDNDPLECSWTVGGTSRLGGCSTTWTSPGIPGYYMAELNVSDGYGNVRASSMVSVSSASPWPRFHYSLQGTGLSPVDTGGTNGTLKWSYTTGNIVYSSPAIGADGTVYVGSQDNKLYAINPDGTLKWSYTTGNVIASSPAIGADGTVYVGSDDNKLYAIETNGTLKWSYPTGGGIDSSPAIGADGTVYVGSNDGKLYAFNPDGTLKWHYTIGGSVQSSPAIGTDGTVYVDSVALNPDGTLKWSHTTGGLVFSSPAIGADGTVYMGSDKLYALNPDGTLKWSYPIFIVSSPSIGADGTVYVGAFDNKLYAINPDGTLKWSYTTGDIIGSSPAIGADGTVYVGSYDSKLYAIH